MIIHFQPTAKLTSLSTAEVQDAIETFENLGLLVRLGESEYRVTQASVHTTDDIANLAIETFHRNMLKAAQEKLQLSVAERESMTMALSKTEFEYLRLRLREIANEIDLKFSGDRKQSEKVYALNLNFIPMTQDFIRLPKTKVSQKTNEVIFSKENSI